MPPTTLLRKTPRINQPSPSSSSPTSSTCSSIALIADEEDLIHAPRPNRSVTRLTYKKESNGVSPTWRNMLVCWMVCFLVYLTYMAWISRHLSHESSNCASPLFWKPKLEQEAKEQKKADSSTCAPITVPVDATQFGARRHELFLPVDLVPDVNQQTTDRGHQLKSLFAFDGMLHLGYGNYNENTGPLNLHAYNPQLDQWFYKGTLATEELRHFRPNAAHTKLFAPEIDAHGDDRRNASGVFELTCGDSHWFMPHAIPGTAHIYDVVVAPNDKLIAGTGARSSDPAWVLESTNGGVTWSPVLRINSPRHFHSRVYFLGATEELTFVSARINHTAAAYVRYEKDNDPKAFQNITNLAEVTNSRDHFRPVVLHGHMILQAISRWPPGEGFLTHDTSSYRIQGSKFVPLDDPWPQVVEGRSSMPIGWTREADRLLLLLADAESGQFGVFRTDSLAADKPKWDRALTLPPLGSGEDAEIYMSLTLLFNDLYLGTSEGNLYVVREFYKPLSPGSLERIST